LHIVYNLVSHKLAGKIDCHSQLGQGTRFTICFLGNLCKYLSILFTIL
jgi:signal transduction histidine kinase